MSPSLGPARARSRQARCETQAARAPDSTRSPCAGGGTNARIAAVDQVREHTPRATGERPAEVSVAGVDPKIVDPGPPDDRHPGRGHRPQSGPEPRSLAIEVARQVGEGLRGVGDDGLAPGVGRRGVVARDLGRAGDAHPVSDRHEAEQLAVVDHRHLWRTVPAAAREGDGQALHRVDRHVNANGAQQRSGEAAHRDYDPVGRETTLVGDDAGHPAAGGLEPLHRRRVMVGGAGRGAGGGEALRELVAVADLVAREVEAAGQRGADIRQRRLVRDAAGTVEALEQQPVPGQELAAAGRRVE